MTIDWQQVGAVLLNPLVLPIALLALAGVVAYIASRRAPGIARLVSLLASACAFALTLRLFLTYDSAAPVRVDAVFLAVNGFAVTIAMASSMLGTLMATAAALIGLLVAIYAQIAQRGKRTEGRFHALLCWSVAGAIGAVLAVDLIWLLLCWEVVSLGLYLLLNSDHGEAPAGAAKTFAMIGFGDAAMLLGIVMLGATYGTFRLDELTANPVQVGTPFTYVCFLLFGVAALTKAGAVPVQSWLPAAATDAQPSAFALLPASIDKLLGVYLLLRCSLDLFVLDSAMKITLMVIGGVTIVAASAMAMMQVRFKRLVAFQAISSTGYIVLGVGTAVPIGLAGAVFHAINGAIYQACLLLGDGNVERRCGSDAFARLGGLARTLPITAACCLVAALAISGVPPLNGFVSKWLVYQACLQQGSSLAMFCLVAAVFGSALTLAASFKLLAAVFLGSDTTTRSAERGRAWSVVPIVVLAALCLVFGIVAQWPLNHLVLPVVAELGQGQTAATATATSIEVGDLGLWSPVPATILILLGLLGGFGLYLIGKATHVRVGNTFVGGELIDRPATLRFQSQSFYRTLEEMPGVGPALRDGAGGAYDVYRLGGRCGGAIVEVLRSQHTGVLSLYVSWCLIGVAVIVAYLLSVI